MVVVCQRRLSVTRRVERSISEARMCVWARLGQCSSPRVSIPTGLDAHRAREFATRCRHCASPSRRAQSERLPVRQHDRQAAQRQPLPGRREMDADRVRAHHPRPAALRRLDLAASRDPGPPGRQVARACQPRNHAESATGRRGGSACPGGVIQQVVEPIRFHSVLHLLVHSLATCPAGAGSSASLATARSMISIVILCEGGTSGEDS